MIAATVNGVRVVDVYCVNGEALGSEKIRLQAPLVCALTDFIRDEMSHHEKIKIAAGRFQYRASRQ